MALNFLSYITLDDLNSLVPDLFISSELSEWGWTGASDKDKTVLLGDAMKLIETLKSRGERVDTVGGQKLKFPMLLPVTNPLLWDDTQVAYWRRGVRDTGIPDELKLAVAKLTVYQLKVRTSFRRKMQDDGVSIMWSGKAKEEYGKTPKDYLYEVATEYIYRYVYLSGKIGF